MRTQIFSLLAICTFWLGGCGTATPKQAMENVVIRMSDTQAEVLNVDSLSVADLPDTVAAEIEPKPILKVEPEYPYSLESSDVTGDVFLKVLVTKTGNVRKVVILSSTNVLFNRSALKAAAMWKFRPATLNGMPVNVWVTIPFRFRLHH
jgi:TonB family protein